MMVYYFDLGCFNYFWEMKVQILFFGITTDLLGFSNLEIEFSQEKDPNKITIKIHDLIKQN